MHTEGRESELLIQLSAAQEAWRALRVDYQREKERADRLQDSFDATENARCVLLAELRAANAKADAANSKLAATDVERLQALSALAAARRSVSNLADAAAEKARTYAMRAAGQREHGSAEEAMYLEARGNSWRDAEEMIRAALAVPAAAAGEDSK